MFIADKMPGPSGITEISGKWRLSDLELLRNEHALQGDDFSGTETVTGSKSCHKVYDGVDQYLVNDGGS